MPIDSPRRGDDFSPKAFSWFPGHMLKAQKRLAEEIKQVDVVLEMRDARLPLGSANPALDKIIARRMHLILFNKSSLADAHASARWEQHLTKHGQRVLFLDADTKRALNLLLPQVDALLRPHQQALRARHIRPPLPRLMVVGIPNVGKSTLINRLAGGRKQKTAPEPGVTRHTQWVNVRGRYELLDTPGVLLPRIADEHHALRLTWIGAVKDTILGHRRVAEALLEHLLAHAPSALASWIGSAPGAGAEELLRQVARQRGFLARGAQPDLNKAAQFVLDQYRAGALGRITFESPPEANRSS